LSGKILIQILPHLLIALTIDLLADSICLEVINHLEVAFMAKSPNAIVDHLTAFPFNLHLKVFLYLVLFGCNIFLHN
jgi:hypothetical protein